MEKKVLLTELVENGSSLRKQITSKVRVSDQGVYPIGEIWDANTTINTIVDGASIAFDTLKETEEKLMQLDSDLTAEINRAKAAEQAETNRATNAENNLQSTKANKADVYTKVEIDTLIGDLGDRHYEVSNSFDYIHDEASWNASYNNGGLKLYYEAYPDEDRYNFNENRPAIASDKVDGEWPDYCPHCWKGAIEAPGAKYPWIVPYFTTDVNSKIIFSYQGKDDVRPWGDRIFGKGNDHKEWGCASIPVELGEEFLLDEDGNTTFELSKFTMTLEHQSPNPYSVKTYIEDAIRNAIGQYAPGSIPADSVTTREIQDGTIAMEDLSDDIKDRIQPTVDEEDENVFIG